jgi:hypothetical protein
MGSFAQAQVRTIHRVVEGHDRVERLGFHWQIFGEPMDEIHGLTRDPLPDRCPSCRLVEAHQRNLGRLLVHGVAPLRDGERPEPDNHDRGAR